MMAAALSLCLLVCILSQAYADVDLITEPRPGEEYVLVSSGQQTPLRNFETSHKIPEKHPQHRILHADDNNDKITKKLLSGKIKHPSEGIVAIEELKKELYKKSQKNKESIEIDLPVSKIEDIKIKENSREVDTNPEMAVALKAMSESGKLSNTEGTTTQKPVLTTAEPATSKGFDYIPINFDAIDDINSGLLASNAKLETAGSEQKQHSRIQIKKGPNGQDYEYEYVYYYYDDEDAKKDKSSSTAAPVHNSHDGPQKVESENQISKSARNKYSTIERSTAAASAVSTSSTTEAASEASRGRARGRHVAPAPVEEQVEEDRLPSSTRFPPRGRNLGGSSSTTHVPEVSSEAGKHRGRGQSDSVADESIGQTRSRTRSHVRRPSSELVDLDSFKTNSGDIPSSSQYKEPPTRYSSESKTTTDLPEATREPSHSKDTVREGHSLLGAIRFQEILDDSKLPPGYIKLTQTTTEQDTTEYTTMAAMEKVALDLYAYLARENLNNDVSPVDFDGTTTVSDETWSTEGASTTEEATTVTTPTTTTTTTTTTPAPTTTTAAPTKPSRFKGRPGSRGRLSTTTSASTEAPETSTRTRGRFNKPGGVRKTTAAAASAAASTTAAPAGEKAVTSPKAFGGRRGLFAGRTRPSSTTVAPAQDNASSGSAPEAPAASVNRPRLRPGLRRTTTTTGAPLTAAEDGSSASPPSDAADAADTTPSPTPAQPANRLSGSRGRPSLKPAAALRPGARLNLRTNPRLRPGAHGAATATPVADTSEAPAETSAPESPATNSDVAESSSPATPETGRVNPRLRHRLSVAPSPKPRVSTAPPPRRPNPLLKRKQQTATTEATTEAAKKATEPTEDVTSPEKSETETQEVGAETTEAPPLRGLDALIARRRAFGGIGARPARSSRASHSTQHQHKP